MRLIGVPVADRPECLFSLDVAFSLAKTLGADVEGYHIVPNRESKNSLSISTLLKSDMASLWPDTTLSQNKKNAVTARKVFANVAAANNFEVSDKNGKPGSPVAVYHEKTGSVQKLLPLIGPLTDMLVVTRPSSAKSAKASIILMSALMSTASPVLVLPSKKIDNMKMERIAIAWDRGQSESVLVHYSLPLLKKMKEVIVFSVGKEHKHGPSSKEVVRYLKAQGVKARTKQLHGKNIAQTLTDGVREVKADALMAGAYTRGSIRDKLFGSVTGYLLEETNLPVILMHV